MVMENRYDKYKDSGIAWIGEIPEHWNKNKIIRLFSIIGSGTTPKSSKEDNYIGSVNWIQSGDINGGYIENCKNSISDTALKEYPTLKIYKAPFIIVAMYGASVGNISISNIDGCVNQACCVMNETKQNFKYLFYAMNSVKKYLIYKAEGGGQPNISQDKIKNTWLPIPPLSEQQSIANYLDQKCSGIDELITLQEEMITKLQSYKQSVITEAVTKGLDKNVPLKDSGIEWIGEIPEHWEVIKTKNAFKIISGATPKTDNMTYWDGEIIWITPADYKTEDRIIKSGKRNITLAGLNSCGTSIVPENSIIFSKRAPIGLVAINVVPLCTNQGCISCIPKSFVSSKYFYYLMSVLTEWFELFGSGTTFKELSTNNFANFSLFQPPLSEQQSIADYLDQKCSEIDKLISIKQQKIEKLKDYKKSLIFECVTGKRKVS